MIRAEHQFPAACPQCSTSAGLPYRAETMANGSVCITLRCGTCRHEWMLEMPPTEVAFAPRQDRRSAPRLN
jgi:hypothetical protein